MTERRRNKKAPVGRPRDDALKFNLAVQAAMEIKGPRDCTRAFKRVAASEGRHWTTVKTYYYGYRSLADSVARMLRVPQELTVDITASSRHWQRDRKMVMDQLEAEFGPANANAVFDGVFGGLPFRAVHAAARVWEEGSLSSGRDLL